MNNGSTTTEPTRPRRRLTLRWFIVVSLFLMIGLGLVVAVPIYQEHQAAERLQARGVRVIYSYRGPAWLKPWLGPTTEDPFLAVRFVGIDLRGQDVMTLRDSLRPMTDLRQLAVWNASIGDDRIGFLLSHPNLQSLSLNRMPLTDADLATIRQLKELRELDLSHTEITDHGLKSLAELSRLEYLRLDGTQVSDAGMRYLIKLPNLTELSVSNTQVTDEGLSLLSGKLPDLALSDD